MSHRSFANSVRLDTQEAEINYFPFHIGDYAVHTRHLTLMEDLAYRRLLDLYYTRETVLPDAESSARLIGMREHVTEVQTVLNDFFTKTEAGFTHKRCDAELAKFAAMAEGGKRGAAKRWAKGGDSPPIATPSPPVTPPNANQEPRTKNHNQEPREKNIARGSRLPDDWQPENEGREFALSVGVSGDTFQNEALKFFDYWRAQPGQKGVKTDWPATWRNWCRNAKPGIGRAPPASRQAALEARNRSVIDEYMRENQ